MLSTVFAIFGSGLLFIGVVIWTVIVRKAESINDAIVSKICCNVAPLLINFFVVDKLDFWGNDPIGHYCVRWCVIVAILGELRLPVPFDNAISCQVSDHVP